MKEILKWGKELAVIAIFIWMALSLRAEWQAGYEQCQKEVAWNAKYNFTNFTIPTYTTNISR